MVDAKTKQATQNIKKHIDFKDVGENNKEGTVRVRSSRLGPKYDREFKRFRVETLEKIELFRAARGKWFEADEDKTAGQIIDSGAYQTLEIDVRRNLELSENANSSDLFGTLVRKFMTVSHDIIRWLALPPMGDKLRNILRAMIIKKLGFKIANVRAHRRTLRPRKFFTLKKNISLLDFDQGQGENKMEKKPLSEKIMREFLKKTKKAMKRMKREEEEEEKKRTADVVDQNVKEDISGKKKKRYRLWRKGTERDSETLVDQSYVKKGSDEIEKEGSATQEPGASVDGKTGDGIISESDKQKMDVKSLEGEKDEARKEEEIEGLGSSDEIIQKTFEGIVEDLRNSEKFEDTDISGENVEKLREIFDEYLRKTEEMKEQKELAKIQRADHFHDSLNKFNTWLGSKYKRLWPSAGKPCNCKILEKDGVFLVKNLCECNIRTRKKTVTIQETPEIIGEPTTGTSTVSDVNAAEPPLKRGNSSNITGKIVDSLEVIRRRMSSKMNLSDDLKLIGIVSRTRPIDDTVLSKIPSEEISALTDKAEVIKDLFLSSRKFDSTTSTRVIDVETKEETREGTKEGTRTPEIEDLQEEETEEILTDVTKLKVPKKRTKTPQKDEVILLKSKSPRKTGVSKENRPTSEESAGTKEREKVKEVKPRRTWSTLSGKNKTISESKTGAATDDSRAREGESASPKPILGKGKRRRTRMEQGHVSFDVSDGQSISSNISKYGQSTKKKIKTVMSVVNIIKKNN